MEQGKKCQEPTESPEREGGEKGVRAREKLLAWAAGQGGAPHRGSAGLGGANQLPSGHGASWASAGHARGAVRGRWDSRPQGRREHQATRKAEEAHGGALAASQKARSTARRRPGRDKGARKANTQRAGGHRGLRRKGRKEGLPLWAVEPQRPSEGMMRTGERCQDLK